MKTKINKLLNVVIFILIIGLIPLFALTSCGTTSDNPVLKQLPPFKFIGKVKGTPVEVTIYPDGSKPTEIKAGEFDIDKPIIIPIGKSKTE